MPREVSLTEHDEQSRRVALVIAGEPEIGRELVSDLKSKNWIVASIGHEASEADLLIDFDLGSVDGIEHAVDRVGNELGAMSAFIWVAPKYATRSFEHIDLKDWYQIIETQFAIAVKSCSVALSYLEAAGGGNIVFVCPDVAWRGARDVSHVAAATGALIGFMKCLALELAPRGILVNAVTADAMVYNALPKADDNNLIATRITPQSVAETVGFLLEDADFFCAQVLALGALDRREA